MEKEFSDLMKHMLLDDNFLLAFYPCYALKSQFSKKLKYLQAQHIYTCIKNNLIHFLFLILRYFMLFLRKV